MLAVRKRCRWPLAATALALGACSGAGSCGGSTTPLEGVPEGPRVAPVEARTAPGSADARMEAGAPSSAPVGAHAAVDEALVASLLVAPGSFDFTRNPKLLERIRSGPHGYFRFINIPFSQALCQRFRSGMAGTPPVNLHGDAHLEQYAVTELGRGLTDFDDASKGPAVLDLLRFGVSIYLALETYGPTDDFRPYFDRFLDGYRQALEDPEAEAPEPGWVADMRSRFPQDRARYLKWIDQVMLPVPAERKADLRAALGDYVRAMIATHPELDPRFFDVVELGYLQMGIGSALDEKYLVRARGPTAAELDDLILELKEVRALSGIECIEGTTGTDPFRILLGQARIAYRPYAYLGYIDFQGKKFWIHSWVENYREIQLDHIARAPEELMQVVYDVGVQLGRGHPKIAGEFELQLRQAQLRFLDGHVGDLFRAIPELGDAVALAWLRFQAALDGRPPP